MRITEDFRKSMNWLHTWLGIGLSGILFAIFWMGTLTVFHMEINKWMVPEGRVQVDYDAPLDPIIMPKLESHDFGDDAWAFVSRPSSRLPLVRFGYFDNGEFKQELLHPTSGEPVKLTETLAASGFFYPFHYSLHVRWQGIGYWLVGLASMAMLALIVSGIFIHRKIIQDFFTFRPTKKPRRSVLDLHNLTAMVALPFHILFPLSGILIFALTYFPSSMKVPFDGDQQALNKARTGYYVPERTGEPGVLPTSLDRFIEKAEAIWTERHGQEARADVVRIQNIGDSSSIVMVFHASPPNDVARVTGNIAFNPETSEIVSDYQQGPARYASAWLEGAHFIRFDSWLVRWLFFFGGLAGCAMIGSGLIFWMHARIRKGMEPVSVRVVRALSVGSMTGMIAASGAYLLINRVLPADAAIGSLSRAYIEVLFFFVVWIATFAHGAIRDRASWREQCWLIAGIAAAAVLANWISTGDYLWTSLMTNTYEVAGTDAVLIAASLTAVLAARRLAKTDRLEAIAALPTGMAGGATMAAAE